MNPISLQAGMEVQTPHGPGIIQHFEVYAPLDGRAHPTAEYALHSNEFPEGSFIRAGIKGCHPTLSLAYYPLNQISLT